MLILLVIGVKRSLLLNKWLYYLGFISYTFNTLKRL